MRLHRLDLTRYGKFTDRSLDFGERPAKGPDFHIIYGPNEAGKSTTMQGWLDLLYGIPAQSRMDFLHPYGAMRLGACIEAGGDRHEVIRTKGRTGTLTDPAGNAIPEAMLQGILGGIDRAGYEAMFSLDDDTLEKGGESILSSQGDLGQMLFTASSGLAEMGQALDDLRGRAHGFFRPAARSGGLADLKKELAALDQAIQDKDVGAREYATLTQERDKAQEAWTTADATQAQTLRRLHEVERLLAALPLVVRLNRFAAELAALPVVAPLPEGWADELAELWRDHGQIAVRIEEQERQIAAMQDELAATIDDPTMLAQADAMAAAEALKADRDGALRDLPNRRAEAASLQAQIDHLLRRLGHADGDAAGLLVPAPLAADLRALMERHSGVV
ncbi:MAG: AAA family ATPase, partial [Paracoccaceae bacterium]|nr:AAA family ATPase [Paracoccaceae bacterium]